MKTLLLNFILFMVCTLGFAQQSNDDIPFYDYEDLVLM